MLSYSFSIILNDYGAKEGFIVEDTKDKQMTAVEIGPVMGILNT